MNNIAFGSPVTTSHARRNCMKLLWNSEVKTNRSPGKKPERTEYYAIACSFLAWVSIFLAHLAKLLPTYHVWTSIYFHKRYASPDLHRIFPGIASTWYVFLTTSRIPTITHVSHPVTHTPPQLHHCGGSSQWDRISETYGALQPSYGSRLPSSPWYTHLYITYFLQATLPRLLGTHVS